MSFGINTAAAMCGCFAGKRRIILMKEFCDVFSELLNKSGLKQKEIAKMLGIKAPYLSKLKSGKLLPQNFWNVQKIADELTLDDDETSELVNAYKKSKFGESYIMLEKAIDKIFSAEFYDDSEIIQYDEPIVKKKNGVVEGKSETEKYIIKILKGKNPRVIYDPRSEEMKKVLESSLPEIDGSIKSVFFINDNKDVEYLNINVEILAGVLPFIMKDKINFRYSSRDFAKSYCNNPFPYSVANDSEQLFINRDLTKSIYVTESDIVQLCNNNFDKTFASFNELCLYFDDPVDFMKTVNCTEIMDNNPFKEDEVFSVGYYPCVILGARFDEISNYVGSYEEKEVLLSSYEKVLHNVYSKCRKLNCICSSEGVKEFLHNEDYVMFNESMSKNLPKHFRHKLLNRVIDVCSQSERINYKVLKSHLTQCLKDFEIDVFSDGKLLLFYMMDNKMKIILFNNDSFTYPIISYYKYLADMDIIYSNEESCNFMKEEMEKEFVK